MKKIIDVYYRIIYEIIYFMERLRNVYKWSKFIWNQGDYDPIYFYETLKFKLEQMVKCFKESSNQYGNVEKDVKDMNKCIEILDRIINEDYVPEDWYNYNKKWGKIIWIPTDKGYKLTRENIKTLEDKKKADEESINIYKKEEELRKQDLKNLYEILEKELDCWWI